MLEVNDRIQMIGKTTNFFCHFCLKIMDMEASASGKSCKENKYATKRKDALDSLCKHDGCKYNSTVCKNHIKENLEGQAILRRAIAWRDRRLRALGHEPNDTVLIARSAEPAIIDACVDAIGDLKNATPKSAPH